MQDHEQRCAELYALGNTPADVPDGLLVIGAMKCTLCKNTMRNNDYPRATKDGTPITWINIDEENGVCKFFTTPGITYDEAREVPMAAGHDLGHTPIFLWVEGGEVKRAALAHGEQPEGALDALVAACRNVA